CTALTAISTLSLHDALPIWDTGPQDYFAVPLARGYEVFRDAYQGVSGLARTVRGPSMSATPGKVCVDGVTEVAGIKVFVLHMIQDRKSTRLNSSHVSISYAV